MMNQSMLPPSTPSEFRPFVDLLRVIADPAGAEKRLQDLAEKIVAATAATNNANNAQAALQVARGSHDDTIRRERADHEKTLAEAQANFDEAHRGREREVANRERAVADRERQVAAAEKAASELKRDLEERLARLRSLAS